MIASLTQAAGSLSYTLGGTLDRLLPVMPYLAVMLSLLVTLALFLALKSDLQTFTTRVRKHAVRERQRVNQLSEDLQELAARPQPTAEPVYLPAPAPTGYHLTGFNINRRVQALRLLRRGEDTAHIAAALGAARQEIELLIRVQKLVAQAKRPVAKPAIAEQPDERSVLLPMSESRPMKSRAIAAQPQGSRMIAEDPAQPASRQFMDGSSEPESLLKPMQPANIGTIRRRKVAILA